MYTIYFLAELGYYHGSGEFVPVTHEFSVVFKAEKWNGRFTPAFEDLDVRVIREHIKTQRSKSAWRKLAQEKISVSHIRLTYHKQHHVFERVPRALPYVGLTEPDPSHVSSYQLLNVKNMFEQLSFTIADIYESLPDAVIDIVPQYVPVVKEPDKVNENNIIPPIPHPHEVGWQQPSPADIKIVDDKAYMSLTTFNKLYLYSNSNPTGAYEGKMWKREIPSGYLLCWYRLSSTPYLVKVETRRIVLGTKEASTK